MKPEPSRQSEPQIQIHVDPKIGQGSYSNLANVGHSPEEFTLDFIYINPTPPAFGKMVSRVIMSPAHAKRFIAALSDNIKKYEEKFGEIKAQPGNANVGPAEMH